MKTTPYLLALALAGSSVTAAAQVPGLPVLQNAFANPGLGVAANFGGGAGHSFFGAAGALGLGGGRFQASAAAGVHRANQASRGAYGARIAANVWTSRGGALAAGAFVGFGGAPRTRDDLGATTNSAVLSIPAGISVGFRKSIGATRGFAIYGSPLYKWSRTEANDRATTSGSLGGSLGVDFAVTQSIGVTAGGEFGKKTGGGTASTLGVAISFVPGR